jgi:hypothetical protein
MEDSLYASADGGAAAAGVGTDGPRTTTATAKLPVRTRMPHGWLSLARASPRDANGVRLLRRPACCPQRV